MEKFKHGSVDAQMQKFGLTRYEAEEKVKLYKEKLVRRKTCKGKKSNPYSVDYQMQRYNLTQEAAEEKIIAIKKSGSQSYSINYQMQKYNLTEEAAEEKIIELKKKTATGQLISDPEWQMKRFNLTRKEAEEKIKTAFLKRKTSYLKLKETDPVRWAAIRKSNKEYWIKNGFSEIDAINKALEFQQNMRNVFIENMKDPLYAIKHFEKVFNWQNKDYVLPSGNIIKLQGYEPQVLTELLKIYSEDDIIIRIKEINNMLGLIKYIGTDNKEHKYYPDFYIKSKNMIIEVKSHWTYTRNKEYNELKKRACLDRGFNFEFMIWNPKTKTISNECII